jgi:hypothetical protein
MSLMEGKEEEDIEEELKNIMRPMKKERKMKL